MNVDGLRDRTLLVLCSEYPDQQGQYPGGVFVKHQLDEIRHFFKKIVVIAPVLSSFGLLGGDKFCRDYQYDNVSVFFPRSHYLPRPIQKRISGITDALVDDRPKVILDLINKYHITFDLVHAHFAWPGGFTAVQLKKILNVPVLLTLHEDTIWFKEDLNARHPKIISAWKGADFLIRVNEKDIPVLKKYNANAVAIRNGFSPIYHPMDQARVRGRLEIPEERLMLFSMGILSERKGFRFLIEAVKILQDQGCEVSCFIAGASPALFGLGSVERDLQHRIRQYGLEDSVRLLGHVPDNQIVEWMNACNLFVLPSLSEAFGIVNIEAMACGKPVVTTYNGGSDEIVVLDIYGYLVDPGDPVALAEAIKRALANHWDNDAIIRYSAHFSWKEVVLEIVTLYQRLLEGGPRS